MDMEKRWAGGASEADSKRRGHVGISLELAQEVVLVASQHDPRNGEAPAASNRLRIVRFQILAVAVSPRDSFDRDRALRIDGIGRSSHERGCQGAFRVER